MYFLLMKVRSEFCVFSFSAGVARRKMALIRATSSRSLNGFGK